MAFEEYQFIEVSMPTTDSAAQEKFWTEVFGAEVLFRGNMMGSPFTRMRVCGITLVFREDPTFVPPPGPGEEFLFQNHLGLRVSDLEASIAELEAKGAQFVLTPAQVRVLQKKALEEGEGGGPQRKYLETTYIADPLTAERIASGEFRHDVAILVGPDNLWIELNQIKEPKDTAWYPGSEGLDG